MGDFNLRLGRQPNRFSLGDFQLRLDPTIEAEIRALATAPPSPRLRQLFVQPNWAAFQQSQLDQLLRQAPPRPTPAFTPGAGPATARAATVGDLMRAIWAVPAVRQSAERVLDEAGRRARRGWNSSTPAERGLLIGHSALIAGGALAGVLSDDQLRRRAFDLVVGKDIPVPGVSGFTVQLRRNGAGATLRNIAGSGVTLRGGGSADGQFDAMLTVDVARWLPIFR